MGDLQFAFSIASSGNVGETLSCKIWLGTRSWEARSWVSRQNKRIIEITYLYVTLSPPLLHFNHWTFVGGGLLAVDIVVHNVHRLGSGAPQKHH
jgi:hypothetical protein